MKQRSLIEGQALSFVSQRIGWIEGCSLSRGPESKPYIQHRGGCKGDQNGAPTEDKRYACAANEPRNWPGKKSACGAPRQGEGRTLRNNVEKNVRGGRAQGSPRPEFTRPCL